MQGITFTVNSKKVVTDKASENTTLLDFLRDELHLTSVKKGCETGNCGVCTVLLDNKSRLSCQIKLKDVSGKSIQTAEELDDDLASQIKHAFLKVSAPQCGFCTPAILLRAYSLLSNKVKPTEAEIVKAISPTICRCTGYAQYVTAVKLASKTICEKEINNDLEIRASFLSGKKTSNFNLKIVGTSPYKYKGMEFVEGKARFTADYYTQKTLFGAIVTSPYPRAIIKKINTAPALALSGVIKVLTAADIPGKNNYGKVIRDREALCSDEVRTVGDPVALVIAETDEIARQAANFCIVDYEILTPILKSSDALLKNAPKIHSNGNLLSSLSIERGDPDSFFNGDYPVFNGHYETSWIDQCPLELASSLAYFDEGLLTVIAPTQHVFFDRLNIARVLGLSNDKVRVLQPAVGGAFGKREDIHCQIYASLAAMKTKMPVRVSFNREEAFLFTTKRHPFSMDFTTAYNPENALILAQKVNLLADGGAYASWSPNVLRKAAVHSCGPYEIANVRIDANVVYTNNPVSGAMRGFGAPQVAFAMESHLDQLARLCKKSPFEVRKLNSLKQGSITVTGQQFNIPIPGKLVIETAKNEFYHNFLYKSTKKNNHPSENMIGYGMAHSFYGIGFGAGIKDIGRAEISMQENGKFLLKTGTVDYGQGADTIFRQIAAEALALRPDDIELLKPDTHNSPNSGSTVASRQTYITGNAVMNAGNDLRLKILSFLETKLSIAKENLFMGIKGVYSSPDTLEMSFPDIYKQRHLTNNNSDNKYLVGYGEFKAHEFTSRLSRLKGQGKAYWPYAFGSQCVEVSVNKTNGEISVNRLLAVQFIGKAINPQQVKGQILGAISMGIGFALHEKVEVREGHIMTRNLKDYHLIRANQMPKVSIILLEDELFPGPYGAVGVGEPPILPTAPAIANAVFDACQYRAFSLPILSTQIKKFINLM